MAEKFVLRDLLSFILIFFYFKICIRGMVTLYPDIVAPVCQVGDQLELTCSTNGSHIRWSFTVRNEQGRLQEYPRFISQDGTQQIHESEITVNSTTFSYMRISAENSSPLISTLVIDPVSRDLNGTIVLCQDVQTSMTATTSIHLLDMNFISPRIIATSVEHRANNILVTMEWIQEEGVQYNISIAPSAPITAVGRTIIVHLLLLYNMEYNVSLEAVAACQSIPPHNVMIRLFYAQCRNLQLTVANDSKPSVVYSDLYLIEGSMVEFICPPGLVLNGTMSATCTENGKWEPDPQDVICIETKCGRPMTSSLVRIVGYDDDGITADLGTTLNFTCPPDLLLTGPNSTTCTGNGEWTPDPSGVMCTQGIMAKSSGDVNVVTVSLATSVAVLLMSNALLFIIGCVYGHYLCQKCKKLNNGDNQPSQLQPTPVYENLQLKSSRAGEQEVELEENVAYGHLQRARVNISSS